MVLASCDGLDVLELNLNGKVTIFILAASKLTINTVSKGISDLRVLNSICNTSPLPVFARTRVWLVPQLTSSTFLSNP